ncbi:MAG TPA: 3-oxoacyl-[acyl-carrier-protein] synthase III C-terminal domain-containing protein [Solirubrobacteraceae bacterium]
MNVLPRISRLAVTEDELGLSQREVLELLGLDGDEFAEGVFGRSAVMSRNLGLGSLALKSTLQGRTALTEEQLFEYAVGAVKRLDVDPLEIGTVVTASLYSLGGPTLAHRLVERFRMDPTTDKYHIVGVGCASAVPLVRLVTQSLDAHPGKKGLIVAAESMSGLLMRAAPGDHRAKTVGSAIFGDGCAAALIENGTSGPAVAASKVHQIEGTLGAVRMELSDEDSYLHLDRDLPDVAAAGLPGLVDEFLESLTLTRDDVDHWIVHPGGRRILDCVRDALGLSHAQLEMSYDVLAERGNVGTPSIFYVLSETIKQRAPGQGERGLMVTVGPGVTIGLMLLVF